MKAFINFGTLEKDKDGKVSSFTPAIQGGGSWIDISSILLQKGFLRTRRIGENGKFARSVLKFSILPTLGSRYIAGEILTAYGDIRAKFTEDNGTPYFIGTIRPTTSMTASNRLEELTLEVIDDSYYLEYVNTRDINIRDCDYVYKQDGQSSLIHRLLEYTGGNLKNINIVADSGIDGMKFDAIAEIKDGKKTKSVFEDILYEYNLQYRFLEDGTMYIMKSYYNSEMSTPIDTITDDKCVKQISVNRSSDSHGGVVVRYRIKTKSKKTIYQYNLAEFLGNEQAQKTYKNNGKAQITSDTHKDIEFPDKDHREVQLEPNVSDSESLLRFYNFEVVTDAKCTGYWKYVWPFGEMPHNRRIEKTVDISLIDQKKISAFMTIGAYGSEGGHAETYFTNFGIRSYCACYDPNADLLKYIIGGDRNGGANEFTDYTCKYLIPDKEETPDDIIALAKRLYAERTNGNVSYQTEMLTENALKLEIGGVYTLKSDFLGITSLVRVLSIADSKESKTDVLSTVKFYGIEDVKNIQSGTTPGGSVIDKPTTFNPLKITASLDRITSTTPTDGVISFVATGDVIDLYNGTLEWAINGKNVNDEYIVDNTIANIPITQFTSTTNIVNVSCTLPNDGGTYSDSITVYNETIGIKVTEERDIHTESGEIHNGISLKMLFDWCDNNGIKILDIPSNRAPGKGELSLREMQEKYPEYIYSATPKSNDKRYMFNKICMIRIDNYNSQVYTFYVVYYNTEEDLYWKTFEIQYSYTQKTNAVLQISDYYIVDDIKEINNTPFVKEKNVYLPCTFSELAESYRNLGGTIYDDTTEDDGTREWVKLKNTSYIRHITEDGELGEKENGIDAIQLSGKLSEDFTMYTYTLKYKIKDEIKTIVDTIVSGYIDSNYSTFQYCFEIKPIINANSLTINGVPLIDIMYPIGKRIYISMDSQDPSVALSPLGYSEWELIGQGRTLWGAGYEYEEKQADGTVVKKTMGAGVNIEAGLPNIAGAGRAQAVGSGYGQIYNGAIYDTGFRSYVDSGTSSGRGYANGIGFDATKGECGTQIPAKEADKDTDGNPMVYENKVYGKSNTVQPPALTVYMWIRVG